MKVTLRVLHHQVEDWLRELEFYKEELQVLSTRLADLFASTLTDDMAHEALRYEAKFINLRQQLDALRDEIVAINHNITEEGKTNPEDIYDKYIDINRSIFVKISHLKKDISQTRFHFNQYLMEVFHQFIIPGLLKV